MERLHGLLWFLVDIYGSIPFPTTGVEKYVSVSRTLGVENRTESQ